MPRNGNFYHWGNRGNKSKHGNYDEKTERGGARFGI